MSYLTPQTGTSSTNAAVTVTHNAVAGTQIEGVIVHWSYDGAPTGGKLTVKKGSTTISEVSVTSAGPGFLPLDGFITDAGEALAVTLAAGGSGVIGKVSLSARLY